MLSRPSQFIKNIINKLSLYYTFKYRIYIVVYIFKIEIKLVFTHLACYFFSNLKMLVEFLMSPNSLSRPSRPIFLDKEEISLPDLYTLLYISMNHNSRKRKFVYYSERLFCGNKTVLFFASVTTVTEIGHIMHIYIYFIY